MALQTRPEPMNASPHHSKVKVTLTLGQAVVIAGEHVTGKMEIECRADRGLGIGIIMIELLGIEELTSRDHSATSTFLHSRRLFQGPGLPPSNAVQPYPFAGDPPIPRDYHQARRGLSTFLFRFPIPSPSPSAITFGSGLACVRYEVRASVGVAWKGDKRLVTDKREIDVVESYDEDFARVEPEGVIIGENGKIWVQGRIVGGIIVGGESTCVELQVKNHSNKRNTGLTLTLTRMLHLPGVSPSQGPQLQISDTLTTVAFRGPEYVIPPGAEGVASLVFDVPKSARGVRGGTRDGGEGEGKTTECLFEVKCVVGIKVLMGIGSKDISLDLPVTITHPSAVPQFPLQERRLSPSYPYTPPMSDVVPPPPAICPVPLFDQAQSPYMHPGLPPSTPLQPFIQQGHVWLLPPSTQSPAPLHGLPVPFPGQKYHVPAPALVPAYSHLPRPSSAGAFATGQHNLFGQQHLLPLDLGAQKPAEPEEGKGERASRISQHLHSSSRNRSVSPQSHRFPFPVSQSSPIAISPPTGLHGLIPAPVSTTPGYTTQLQGEVHSPRPLLSPKQSFTVDHVTQGSIPKSMRVEELERMAEEFSTTNENLSGDVAKFSLQSEVCPDKTLPPPPVPTGKDKLRPPLCTTRPRAGAVFTSSEQVDAQRTPPTPTLTAITPSKPIRHDDTLRQSENGLDALERRLLAEVGTRKIEVGDRRLHVGGVLPIGIPQTNTEIEPLHDSAISSLTLAEHDSDERTHKAGKSTGSGDDRDLHEHGRGERPVYASNRSETERGDRQGSQLKKGKKKERARDGDAHRLRKSAKGRVAAWLGEIGMDAPPPETPPGPDIAEFPISSSDTPYSFANATRASIVYHPKPLRGTPDQEISSAPNPRSSGFIPIEGNTSIKRPSALKSDTTIRLAEKLTNLGAPTNAIGKRALFPAPVVPQTLKTDRAVSPPSFQGDFNDKVPLAPEDLRPLFPQVGSIDNRPSVKPPPRLPVFPPPRLNSEVKYDIRSARGGRGGHVTAVASMWASAAAQKKDMDTKPQADAAKVYDYLPKRPNPKSGPSKGAPNLIDFARNPSRPVVKSMSVPAVISSSHATPTLSSTASLARATAVSPNKTKPHVKTLPTTQETPSDPIASAKISGVRVSVGEPAFGQARLRDLIKKYQGQAS